MTRNNLRCRRCGKRCRRYVRGYGFVYCLHCYGRIYGFFED